MLEDPGWAGSGAPASRCSSCAMMCGLEASLVRQPAVPTTAVRCDAVKDRAARCSPAAECVSAYTMDQEIM